MRINSNTSFAIIGGDKRQIYMANSIYRDGYTVQTSGLDSELLLDAVGRQSPAECAESADIIIFPLPAVRNGAVYSPVACEPIEITSRLLKAVEGKKIFCGKSEDLYAAAPSLNRELMYDILKREDFAVLNAVPTAEGALECAFANYDGTIKDSRCLVCGYGRIGKILSSYLKMLGADVTVSARKAQDAAWIKANSLKFVHTEKLYSESGFNIIFNTVPHLIFNSHLLAKIASDALVIDLASIPGGVDFEACGRLGIRVIHALSLPGKSSPKTAGEIIKDTIYNMLEEEKA